MNQYKNARFIHLFLRFSIIFFVIVTILKLGMGFFRFNGIEGMKNEYLIDGKWQPFVQLQVVMSLIYGLFMAVYYKLIKK
jgi:hypothetical protein